ncbi:Imidazole glycerol phosphate synthase subunit HisH [[Clostridium] cellulosi]|jgi:imidazole glycerol phosphate synthase subunit hisH (EC 2.4.2.-)|uniref:Imidazole glycerol phosphate synthase subunit HisH n=1 Tax=[Clostridium] cellulosi TaxID=29343 RepID=A0A078KNV4_9FIRM|nr:Imidazole glycerol phosphate synthase subunit HisH [[Clostridium] cellulosi]
MIAVIDCNVGNLFSVKNALDYIGEESVITNDVDEIEKADGLILPGVGAFPNAMREVQKLNLQDVIKEQAEHKPLLGICLGMQMLFDKGFEFEECNGLGLIPGEIRMLPDKGLKIPHMGWNALQYKNPSPLLDGIPEGSYFYFVHSYMAYTDDKYISAYAEYGDEITTIVWDGKYVFGSQCHPEKSGEIGLMLLKNFGRLLK